MKTVMSLCTVSVKCCHKSQQLAHLNNEERKLIIAD